MTLTRWKLMAGVFGLSMCGLAALAEPACRTVGYAHRQQPAPLPLPEPGGKPTPPPLEVTPPTPAPLPLVSKVDSPPPSTEVPAPLPLPLPKIEAATPATPPPAFSLPPIGEPKVVAGGMDEKSFVDLAKTQLKLPELPTLEKKDEATKPTGTLPLPTLGSKTAVGYKLEDGTVLPTPPNITPSETLDPKGRQPVTFPQSPIDYKPSSSTLPKIIDVPLAEMKSVSPTIAVKAEVPPAPAQLTPRTVETTPSEPVRVSTTVATERKLKVQLHLGGGKPWFEVRDGEELVLKVVSDAIEVKAPADNGDAASVLKASGTVSFRTLGANGTCDELRVIPGTGEVVVSGRVAVTSNWGKSETTATADKMTFKLGGQVLGMTK